MSLFIAGEAFAAKADFEAAKIAVLAASLVAAALGVLTLEAASRSGDWRCMLRERRLI